MFLANSDGMDIKINNTPATGQYLEYNIIGGVFDLYFLSGPTPKEAAAQYADTVGHAVMMPYWSFGFHQCRYGMQDVYEVAGVVANYSLANIPLETMWTDIDVSRAFRPFLLVTRLTALSVHGSPKSLYFGPVSLPSQPHAAARRLSALSRATL